MLGAGAALTGCGFHPVYMPTASGKAGVAQRELAAIHVDLIPERPGQLLRQALQDRFEGASDTNARQYDLVVVYWISGEGIAILNNDAATRVRIIGNARWTLSSQDPAHTKITNGFATVNDALNVLDSQYFAADLESEALQRRVADAVADQITIQLATFFRKRAGGLNG